MVGVAGGKGGRVGADGFFEDCSRILQVTLRFLQPTHFHQMESEVHVSQAHVPVIRAQDCFFDSQRTLEVGERDSIMTCVSPGERAASRGRAVRRRLGPSPRR